MTSREDIPIWLSASSIRVGEDEAMTTTMVEIVGPLTTDAGPTGELGVIRIAFDEDFLNTAMPMLHDSLHRVHDAAASRGGSG